MAEAVRADGAATGATRVDAAHGARGADRRSDDPDRKSVFQLIGELPGLVSTLIRDEIESLRKELTNRLKAAGIGIGFFAGAAVLGYFAVFLLLTAAVAGLATVLPVWLSALIIGVLFLIGAGILALIGLRRVKKGVPPVPESSIESVKSDVKAFKGVGSYDR